MKLSALGLLLFCCLYLPAQVGPEDLLVPRNDFEASLFKRLSKGDTSHLGLMLAASGRVDSLQYEYYLQELEKIYTSLDSAKLLRRKPKRQIEEIFETVHQSLLKQYQFKNQFVEIFESGNYNCVSATAVYCAMLSRLGIPFLVIESPNHVYAVAHVEDEEWVMESTDPKQGYYELDEDFFEEQLEELVEQKIITPEQAESDKLDSIIYSMFPSEQVNTTKLVSMQYSNQVLYDFEEGNIYEAYQNAVKCYLIYRSDKHRDILNETLAYWLDEDDFNNPLFYKSVTYFLTTDTMQNKKEAVVSSFLYYGNKMLADSMTAEQFDAIHQAYLEGVENQPELQGELNTLYYLIFAEGLLAEKSYPEAFKFSHKALMASRHEEAVNYLLNSLNFLHALEIWQTGQALDSMQVLQELYPEVQQFHNWNSFYAELLLQDIYQKLNFKKLRETALLRQEFEALMDNEDLDKTVSSRMIGLVYSRLALHDYNRSKAKAAETLARGLEYAPNSEDIQGFKERLGL